MGQTENIVFKFLHVGNQMMKAIVRLVPLSYFTRTALYNRFTLTTLFRAYFGIA